MHALYKCPIFPNARDALIRDNHFCLNFFSFEHFVQNCSNKQNCKVCGNRHHSILHYKDRRQKPNLITYPQTTMKLFLNTLMKPKL